MIIMLQKWGGGLMKQILIYARDYFWGILNEFMEEDLDLQRCPLPIIKAKNQGKKVCMVWPHICKNDCHMWTENWKYTKKC